MRCDVRDEFVRDSILSLLLSNSIGTKVYTNLNKLRTLAFLPYYLNYFTGIMGRGMMRAIIMWHSGIGIACLVSRRSPTIVMAH
jgi:hypothetical protein